MRETIPLSIPYVPEEAHGYIQDVLQSRRFSAPGRYTKACADLVRKQCPACGVLLTNSASTALDVGFRLLDLEPGDEVILPSFTFPSAASAIVKAGAVPVYVDIEQPSLNISADCVASAITPRTRAVVATHYAGRACDMGRLQAITVEAGLCLVEDAAHAYGAKLDGSALGTIGRFGVFSFQQTKNLSVGEGGALIVSSEDDLRRAEIITNKGTDAAAMHAGRTSFYQWMDVGTGGDMNEISAAVLRAQLEHEALITNRRIELWNAYHETLTHLQDASWLTLPPSMENNAHNAHLFHILLTSAEARDGTIQALAAEGITAASHYFPLHRSEAGRRYGRVHGDMVNTEQAAGRVLRLPLFPDLDLEDIRRVCDVVSRYLVGGSSESRVR